MRLSIVNSEVAGTYLRSCQHDVNLAMSHNEKLGVA